MKTAIYARCSTDESRQDVQNQITECQRYCRAQKWPFEVFQEYETAYKDNGQRKVFKNLLDRLRKREFDCLMVYMLDRFSRQTPTKIVSDLHTITENHNCRFISLKEGIDSKNEMWQIIMMVFAWMANNYSKMQGIRIKEAIARQKQKGEYTGGRPKKSIDPKKIKRLYKSTGSLRKTTQAYNKGLIRQQKISYKTAQTALKQL